MSPGKQWLNALLLGGLLFLLLAFPAATMDGARAGLRLWADSVLPALLPFFVLTNLLVLSGLFTHMQGALSLPSRLLLRCRGAGGAALLLCLVAGAPTAARLCGQLHQEGLLTRDEAARVSAAGTVTGPLFLIGTVGAYLGSPALGALVYALQVASALVNGLIWRGYGRQETGRSTARAAKALSPFYALPQALRESCLSVLFVGAAIAVFAALRSILMELGLFEAMERALSHLIPRQAVTPLLSGLLEVSMGCKEAALSPLPLALRLSLLCGVASFGGFSVFCQSACFLEGIVPMRVYLAQRLTHAALGFILCRGALLFFQPLLPVAALAPTLPAAPGMAALAALGLGLVFGWLPWARRQK